VLTIGHSTHSIEKFLRILQAHHVELVVDVRRFPRSRRNPWFNVDAMPAALAVSGIAYVPMPALGGRRPVQPASPNTGWRNAGFRGYADYMQTPEFQNAMEELMALENRGRAAVMCAESMPWRCHRSLIADALTARGLPVEHIFSESARKPHELTPFARVEGTRVTYPPEQPGLW
jgi:uncharacterized protein (DUF488 family)